MHPLSRPEAQNLVRIQISDSAPGSGPARDSYLRARLQRLLAPFAAYLKSVELELSFDGVQHEVSVAVRYAVGVPALFHGKARRMTTALANPLDATRARLEVQFPGVRSRDEAM